MSPEVSAIRRTSAATGSYCRGMERTSPHRTRRSSTSRCCPSPDVPGMYDVAFSWVPGSDVPVDHYRVILTEHPIVVTPAARALVRGAQPQRLAQLAGPPRRRPVGHRHRRRPPTASAPDRARRAAVRQAPFPHHRRCQGHRRPESPLRRRDLDRQGRPHQRDRARAGLEAEPLVDPHRDGVAVVAARAHHAGRRPASRAALRAAALTAPASPRPRCSGTHPTGSTSATPVSVSSHTHTEATIRPSPSTATQSRSWRYGGVRISRS